MKRKLATRLLGLALSAGVAVGVAVGQDAGPVIHQVDGAAAGQQPGAMVGPVDGVLVEEPPAEEATPADGVPACGPPVACYARPEMPQHYTGYYVGGGCPCKGSPPDRTQGTWGWDYKGVCFPRNVWLKYCCRYQGGAGAYKTDGPHVPNVLEFPPHKHGAKEEGEHGKQSTHGSKEESPHGGQGTHEK